MADQATIAPDFRAQADRRGAPVQSGQARVGRFRPMIRPAASTVTRSQVAARKDSACSSRNHCRMPACPVSLAQASPPSSSANTPRA